MIFIGFEIEFYKTEDGKSPAQDFIQSQNEKIRRKIYREMELLENLGTALRMPHSEYLGDSIFQLRVQTEGTKVRILYFFLIGQQAILTNGFIKKTPRTPKNELELAKKYKTDYLKRKGAKKI